VTGRRRGAPAPAALVVARAALAVCAAAASGCGYSTSRLVSVPGVSTVAVVQFENETFRRDLEQRLTQAVAEEVRARTSWRIASPATADALLSGTIRSAETRVLAEDRAGEPLADRLTVVVEATLVDRRSGRVLRRWHVVSRDEFTRRLFGESLEGSGIDAAARSLAEDVVAGLERPIAPVRARGGPRSGG
jgi:hypothetical protein